MSLHNHILNLFTLAMVIGLATSSGVVAQTDAQRAALRAAAQAAAQATGGAERPVIPTGESKQPIALTLWALTMKESTGPEEGELEGALQDKANNLPAVVGTKKEVREMIAKLKVAGLLHKSREIRLGALDGQTATASTSFDQPSIQSTNFTESGPMNTIMYRTMGTIVQATPLIDSDGLIQVGLSYESSFFEVADGVVIAEPEGKDPILAPLIVKKSTKTLARIESGKAVLVSSDAAQDAYDEKSPGQVDLLILAAEIVSNE